MTTAKKKRPSAKSIKVSETGVWFLIERHHTRQYRRWLWLVKTPPAKWPLGVTALMSILRDLGAEGVLRCVAGGQWVAEIKINASEYALGDASPDFECSATRPKYALTGLLKYLRKSAEIMYE